MCELVLMRVPDDQTHARQCRNLFRRTLRIASRDYDSRLGIPASNAADSCPRILIGGGSNRAGVKHHYARMPRRSCARKPAFFELALQRRAICLRSAAPKVFNVVSRHLLIVTQAEPAGWPFPRTQVEPLR